MNTIFCNNSLCKTDRCSVEMSLGTGIEGAIPKSRSNALKIHNIIKMSRLVKHLFHCEADVISQTILLMKCFKIFYYTAQVSAT